MSRNKREGRYAGYCPNVGHVRGNYPWATQRISTRCALGMYGERSYQAWLKVLDTQQCVAYDKIMKEYGYE